MCEQPAQLLDIQPRPARAGEHERAVAEVAPFRRPGTAGLLRSPRWWPPRPPAAAEDTPGRSGGPRTWPALLTTRPPSTVGWHTHGPPPVEAGRRIDARSLRSAAKTTLESWIWPSGTPALNQRRDARRTPPSRPSPFGAPARHPSSPPSPWSPGAGGGLAVDAVPASGAVRLFHPSEPRWGVVRIQGPGPSIRLVYSAPKGNMFSSFQIRRNPTSQ